MAAAAATVYYSDTTPPAESFTTSETMVEGIAGKIEYALFSDQTTWDLWYAWARANRAAGNSNHVNYSAQAYILKGTWPTVSDNDFMCMADASSNFNNGGWCVAFTPAATPKYRTFRLSATQFNSLYTATFTEGASDATKFTYS